MRCGWQQAIDRFASGGGVECVGVGIDTLRGPPRIRQECYSSMTTPLPLTEYETTEMARQPAASNLGSQGLLIDQLRKGWSSIAFGIIVAGGAYPVIAGLGGLLIGVIFDRPSVSELIGALFLVGPYSMIAALVGLVWTNVVVVVTLPAMLLVVWSLRMRGSIVWLGAFWGGLVGFAAAWPVAFFVGVPSTAIVALAVGPGLTTIIGQIGGAWGGRRAIERMAWYERALSRASVETRLLGATRSSTTSLSEAKEDKVAAGAVRGTARFQFGIRHLMWAAVWISVLLSLIRLVGIRLEVAVPVLAGWVLYQMTTLVIGGMIFRWYGRRHAGRH